MPRDLACPGPHDPTSPVFLLSVHLSTSFPLSPNFLSHVSCLLLPSPLTSILLLSFCLSCTHLSHSKLNRPIAHRSSRANDMYFFWVLVLHRLLSLFTVLPFPLFLDGSFSQGNLKFLSSTSSSRNRKVARTDSMDVRNIVLPLKLACSLQHATEIMLRGAKSKQYPKRLWV